MFKQALIIISFALFLGTVRQFLPGGISFRGYWPGNETSPEEAYSMLAEKDDPPFISLKKTAEALKHETAVILDARTPELFAEGHIPGARNLPFYQLDEFQEKALDGLASDSFIIIYCEGIGCELSFFLGRELNKAGYENVHIFYGGYPEWKGAGYPIERESAS